MPFDDLANWCFIFHIIWPIIPDNGGAADLAIHQYVEWLSKKCNFPIMGWDGVLSRGNQGLVSCTCEDYQHYLLCKHVFLILKCHGIIHGHPATPWIHA